MLSPVVSGKISRQTKTTKRVVEETPIIKNKKKNVVRKQTSAKSKVHVCFLSN